MLSLNTWEQSLTNFKKELETLVEREKTGMKGIGSSHVLDGS